MTGTTKLILAAAAAAAALLAAAYSAMERADTARSQRFDWSDITSISSARGPGAAAEELEKKLKTHPKDALLHYYRARLYYDEGRGEAALAEADLAIDLGYAQEVSHLLKAIVYGRLLGDRAAQRDLASKALAFDPTYADGYLIRAEAGYRLGEYEACASDAASYSSLSPGESDGYELAQLCLEGLRDFDGAEKAARKLLEIDAGNHAALWRLGMISALRGRHEDAVKRFSDAIRLSGGKPKYYLDRAASCSELGDFSCAAWDLASASEWKVLTAYASHYQLLGENMYRIGELDHALEAARKAVSMAPAEAAGYSLRGRLRAEKGDLAGAARDLAAAEALAPGREPDIPRILSAAGKVSKKNR